MFFVGLNPCWAEDQIMDPGQCSPRPQSKPYDHRLAAELAAWSSLAYINPNKISRDTMQHLISSKIGRDFRVSVHYTFHNLSFLIWSVLVWIYDDISITLNLHTIDHKFSILITKLYPQSM